MRVALPILLILWSSAQLLGQHEFQYDEQGRLIADATEEIVMIEWNNQNKIVRILRSASSSKPDLEYAYDALGNKVMRLVKPRNGSGLLAPEHWEYFYYVNRDRATPIAAYHSTFIKRSGSQYTQTFSKEHQRLFFDHPIGMVHDYGDNVTSRNFSAQVSPDGNFINMEEEGLLIPPVSSNSVNSHHGHKRYELINHQQNVHAVVSDRTLNHDGVAVSAEVTLAADYYPYGMIMPQRKALFESFYPFGFTGKQKEINEAGNSYDFGGRMYNGRLGRWMSIDPMHGMYPSVSPYNYAMNNPIALLDPDGNKVVTTKEFDRIYGKYYNALKKTQGFKTILRHYQKGRTFMFEVDDVRVLRKSSEDNVDYFAVTKPVYRTVRGKRAGLVRSVSTFTLVKLVAGFNTENIDGEVKQRPVLYTDIFIASAIIHEAIHGLEDVENFPKDKNPNHATFNKYHNLMVETLKEYVKQENLDYSDDELEALAWHGTDQTTDFDTYIQNKALKATGKTDVNELTKEEIKTARARWRTTVDDLMFNERENKEGKSK